jgi:hypothetical protein
MSEQTTAFATSQIPNIDDLEPLNKDDELCLQEVRQVLERHNRLSRFGVNLLHNHFAVADDEVLLEECDVENRTFIVKPVKKSDLASRKLVETNWSLSTGKPMLVCNKVCAMKDTGGHAQVHMPMPDPKPGD